MLNIAWRRLTRVFLDVLFAFLIPVGLLAPGALHLPWHAADHLGVVGAYILAGLIPAAYAVWDTLRRGSLNPFVIFALASALSGGLLSFARVDGVWFALKDAYHSALLALACAASLALGHPLFELIFYGLLSPDSPQRSALLRRALAEPPVRRRLAWATGFVLVKAVVLGVASFLVARAVVTARFGTPEFNDQVGHAHTLTFPLALVLDLLAYGGALLLVQAALNAALGLRVRVWEAGLWRALEERMGHQPPDVSDELGQVSNP